MPKLKINNQEVEIEAGQTLLQAARKLGIRIPTLCYMDGLPHYASCMVCMVRDSRNGKFHPSCSTRAEEGMEIETETPAVREMRKASLDLILSEHVGDCEAPCQRACPAHMNIPQTLRLVTAGMVTRAIENIRRDVVLPGVIEMICPAPCEKACRRGRVDQAASICLVKRYTAEADYASGNPWMPEIPPDTGRKIAVIGAGPFGMSAAAHLRRKGHAVTIFDDHNEPGGALYFAVPRDKLPLSTLERDVAWVKAIGVKFQMMTKVGLNLTMDDLKRDFDVIIIGAGFIGIESEKIFGVKCTQKGITVNPVTYQTSDPHVFAGGGVVADGRVAVKSVYEGKVVAASVDQLLKGDKLTGIPKRFASLISSMSQEERDAFMEEAKPIPRVIPLAGVPTGFSCGEAADESARCMHCDCRKANDCTLRELATEYGATIRAFSSGERPPFEQIGREGNVIFEPGKCIKCGICIRITERDGEELGLTFVGRGFDVTIGAPLGAALDKALEKTAKEVVRCCPTGALAFKDDLWELRESDLTSLESHG
jgi:NADPH-dependent 2,4-dienoyl-CoA reductase/sulfur reductase-like enzyme